jgi:L-seryl-tRNA(Ser) seleniumtransferase
MIARTSAQLRALADQLRALAGEVRGLELAVEPCTSAIGGGAMPTAELPSFALTVRGVPPDELDRRLRAARVPVIGRIADGRLWLDVRTVAERELADVAAALRGT